MIASVNGTPALTRCLDALCDQITTVPYEVLVVDRCGAEVKSLISERYSEGEIRLVETSGQPSIPRLRSIGIGQAQGEYIAIIEDHMNVPQHWIGAIAELQDKGHDVAGGPVANGARERVVDWAVFFLEYARFMAPMEKGEVDEIAGSCAVYRKDVLDQLNLSPDEEVWESVLHSRIAKLGIPLVIDPRLAVDHEMRFGFGYFMSQRYHYSRSFAGQRLSEAPALRKLIYAAATPLLPPLLLWRTLTQVWQRRTARRELALATPLIALFLLSYAFGEAVGALAGPGDSLRRVE